MYKFYFQVKIPILLLLLKVKERQCVVPTNILYCHVTEGLQTGIGLMIGFTEHLQIVTTSNYSAIANLHIQ
jgi:hypothetical protein